MITLNENIYTEEQEEILLEKMDDIWYSLNNEEAIIVRDITSLYHYNKKNKLIKNNISPYFALTHNQSINKNIFTIEPQYGY